jgi:hypothetical protein
MFEEFFMGNYLQRWAHFRGNDNKGTVEKSYFYY